MQEGKKIYFASDFHLGIPNYEESRKREKIIIQWLNSIKPYVEELYLLGDVFDFWFEYRTVIPKGYTRLLAKLAEFTDANIPVHFFTGNHDLWVGNFFEKEIGMKIYKDSVIREINGKKFYLAHGDGLGPGDARYKFMKKCFKNPVLQWAFGTLLHPNFADSIARKSSKNSRLANGNSDEKFYGEKEWLYIHSKNILQTQAIDYFIYGHRHIAIDLDIDGKARYLNLGEWVKLKSYAEFDGAKISLKYFQQ